MIDRAQAEAAAIRLQERLTASRIPHIATGVSFRHGNNPEYQIFVLLYSPHQQDKVPRVIDGVHVASASVGEILSVELKTNPAGWSNATNKRPTRVSVDRNQITVGVGIGG